MGIVINVATGIICITLFVSVSTILHRFTRSRSPDTTQCLSAFMSGVSFLGLWQEKAAARPFDSATIIIGLIGFILLIIHLQQPVQPPIRE